MSRSTSSIGGTRATGVTNVVSLADVVRKKRTIPRKNKRDWRFQIRSAITSAADLSRALSLTEAELAGAKRAEERGLPISITPYYLALADKDDPNCPIRKQCVPTIAEDETHEGDLEDPLGEVAHEVSPGLVQRYPDRALLLATDRCAVYCRFCTRSRMVGDGGGALAPEKLHSAINYLRNHPEIRDVIVSGGDPLAMATDRLVRLVGEVRSVPSVETIRLATRVPVTLPMRITRELLRALRPLHPLWVMTHFNHPKELTRESIRACTQLADAGFPVMNQTVLLRGINDSADTLEALFRGLIRARVRPYYLLQMDPVVGTSHLRTPLARGIAIMEKLQGRLTGIALPKLICDTPGGRGKVPLGPQYIVSETAEPRESRQSSETSGAPKKTVLRTFRGELVMYTDPRDSRDSRAD